MWSSCLCRISCTACACCSIRFDSCRLLVVPLSENMSTLAVEGKRAWFLVDQKTPIFSQEILAFARYEGLRSSQDIEHNLLARGAGLVKI